MHTTDPRATDCDNELLAQVVADYVRAVEAGDSPDRDQVVAEHPELAEELREFFRHRDRMQALLDPLRSAAARVLCLRCPHCRGAIELLDHVQVTDLSCPSCGTNFSLVGAEGQCYPNGLKRIGQFQLVEQVGVGQFGSVWKARDLTLERTVAIKFPRSHQLDESEAEMFLRDARLAAQLNHPNIVGVHEVGKQDGTIFIVTDFIHGKTLKQWTVARRLTAHEAARLCVKVARALHHAHELGVIHRDLKPGNIMMDLAGEPHLVDFGLAKRDSGEITMTLDGQILGTPAYMSPEQARGECHGVDRRADVYAMGVILFELLTGELPFRGDQQMLLVQIRNDPPPSPRKFNAGVPRDLETICLKCLEKEPQRRYESAEMFADDGERFLNGRPVIARPISRMARAWRWCLRKPMVAGLLATVATLLLGIAVVSSIGLWATQSALELARNYADTNEQNLYFSQMNRAGIAASDPDGLALIATTLDQWQPKQTLVDRRGWEWYYLETLLHQELMTLRGDAEAVLSVAWSPDGSRLAAAGNSRLIRIWNGSGKLTHTLWGHRQRVNSLAWNQDGSLLASASDDGTLRIWDATTAGTVITIKHDGPVHALSWSADGQQLAAASQDPNPESCESTVVIWRADGWEKEHSVGPIAVWIDELDWHPSGPQLAIGSSSGVHVWTPATGRSKRLPGRSPVAWNHDGTQLAVSRDEGIEVYRVDEEVRIAATASRAARARCAAWSPGGSLLAYAEYKAVSLHDVESDTERLTLSGHLRRVLDVAWHPQGERLATASEDGTVKIWSCSPAPELSPGAAAISWHPRNPWQYASRIRNDVVICDARTSQVIKRLAGHTYWAYAIAWSPNGQKLATADYGGEVRIWDVDSGATTLILKTELKPQMAGPSWFPCVLEWSPNGLQLAIKHSNYQVRIVDASSGRSLRELRHDPVAEVLSFAWSPDGSRIVATGKQSAASIWQSESGRTEKRLAVSGESIHINSVCWSPDGSRIAIAGGDTSVQVWDVAAGRQLHHLQGHTAFARSVSWSPDGRRIASSDESGNIRIWDARTGQQAISLAYPGPAPMVAWNSDGTSLACVGYGGDTAIKIWRATIEPSLAEPYW